MKLIFKISDQDFLENFLNLAHQGEKKQAMILFSFYSLFKGMHIDDFIHYFKEAGL